MGGAMTCKACANPYHYTSECPHKAADDEGASLVLPGKLDKPCAMLVPVEAIESAAIAMAAGIKGGRTVDGWKVHIFAPAFRRAVIAATWRHWAAIVRGELMDDGPEGTGQPHAASLLNNAAMLTWWTLEAQAGRTADDHS